MPPPRRSVAREGHRLKLDTIRGPAPFGTVGGVGVFAIVWETAGGPYWAALHDFEPSDQLRLFESCRRLDIDAFGSNDARGS